jgi:lipopolysaccharide/colanic/teichoic acid biosynthesis glycosyltransferase
MARRLCDVVVAAVAVAALAPLWLLLGIAIRASSPGPVFYRARRVGRGAREFTMYKFRTMHLGAEARGPITASDDPRVFRIGAWLRAWKMDELPQLINVVKGDMAIVGPRPEDPAIVRAHYTAEDYLTLSVLPGLASPGSIYNYTHGEQWLVAADAADTYVRRLLPIKLQLDRTYVRNASPGYDLRIVLRTIGVLAARALGQREFSDPPEMAETRTLRHTT